MYPLDYEEETSTRDLTVDDASSMLRATADLFEESARATSDVAKREMLLDYAKLYRGMADLSDKREQEDEDDDRPE